MVFPTCPLSTIEGTNLFSKLPQMLPKKAKMAFWRLGAGGTLIRTRAFCSSGHFLVAQKFSDALKLRKIHLLCLDNKLKVQNTVQKSKNFKRQKVDFP